MNQTKVKFWLTPNGEVMAHFPELHYAADGDGKVCYFEDKVFSGCDTDYLNVCIEATPKRYASMKEDLENLGYKLEILNTQKKKYTISLVAKSTDDVLMEVHTDDLKEANEAFSKFCMFPSVIANVNTPKLVTNIIQ